MARNQKKSEPAVGPAAGNAPSTYSSIATKLSRLLRRTDVTSSSSNQSGGSLSQYDALPVGATGTYDPAADEIDYMVHQSARPCRRRLLYQRLQESSSDVDETKSSSLSERSSGAKRKGRGNGRDGTAGRTRYGAEDEDSYADGNFDEGEFSAESLLVILLVFASSAFTMLVAYLVLM